MRPDRTYVLIEHEGDHWEAEVLCRGRARATMVVDPGDRIILHVDGYPLVLGVGVPTFRGGLKLLLRDTWRERRAKR